MTEVLEQVAARYAGWLGSPAADTAEPEISPEQVRAMPIILRLERSPPPALTPLLEAAASAALAVCVDDRAGAGGPWHEAVHAWVSGHIRKVARRARGSHWDTVCGLAGVTAEVDGAAVRALVPCRVADLPKEVSRLQVSGTELPADDPGPAPEDRPLLLLNPNISMSAGKAAAQVGHATMLLAALLDADRLAHWAGTGLRCAVRTATPAEWWRWFPEDPAVAWERDRVIAVRDAGFTEIAPGTVTVLARWRT